MKIDEYQELEEMMALFKGESGTGKTIAAASYPEPVYIASMDGRIAPLKHYTPLQGRDINFDVFVDYKKIIEKLGELTTSNQYRTFVLDGLMGYSRLIIAYMMNNRGGATEVKVQGEKQPLTIGGIPIMAINEYKGESSALFNMTMALRVLKQHKANVILTAHVVVSEQEVLGGHNKISRQLLTGGTKIAAEIPTYFDEVYHFYNRAPGLSDAPKFTARTISSGDDYARTSFYGLKNEIDFTDKLFYNELMNRIKEIK